MPYQKGSRLGGERASKLGHLDVIQSELVNKIIEEFESPADLENSTSLNWVEFDAKQETQLNIVFSVDGSIQEIRSDQQPWRELAFVKVALLSLRQNEIDKLDRKSPHPLALRDIMKDSAIQHSTVLPLKNISLPGMNNCNAVRKIVFDSLKDASIDGIAMDTLKWLFYEKWTGDTGKSSPEFQCPHCEEVIAGLPYDAEIHSCSNCSEEVFISDVIGFHLEMADDSTPGTVASSYMLIYETLLLFTGIRFFWEQDKLDVLQKCLFIKDGPLTLRSQYSKLAIPIRRLFAYAKSIGVTIHMVGQEKTGSFVDHLELISRNAPSQSYFLPDNDYIRSEIQQRPTRSEDYGLRTNYGNKVFVKTDDYHSMVLSIPTGEYTDSDTIERLHGAVNIISALKGLISYKHENALVPIELANGVASLSSYPSAAILKLFSGV